MEQSNFTKSNFELGESCRPMARKASRQCCRHRGITLVEIAIVVAIIAILATLANTVYQGYRERIKVDQAVADILLISAMINDFKGNYGRLPLDLAEIGRATSLDPWGHPYDYVNHQTASPGQFRKDKNIVPINSDFDLGSMGKDGASVAPLTAKASRDDIIRANDGAFVGMASVYDP